MASFDKESEKVLLIYDKFRKVAYSKWVPPNKVVEKSLSRKEKTVSFLKNQNKRCTIELNDKESKKDS